MRLSSHQARSAPRDRLFAVWTNMTWPAFRDSASVVTVAPRPPLLTTVLLLRSNRHRVSSLLLALAASVGTAHAQGTHAHVDRDTISAPTDTAHRTVKPAPTHGGGLRVLPVVSHAPETGIGLGAALVRVTRNLADTTVRPSTLDGVLVGTQKKQAKFLLEDEIWTSGNRWRIYGSLAFDRTPTPFYGVLLGAHAPVDPLAFYSTDTYGVYLTADHQVRPGLYLGVGIKSTANHAVADRPDSLVADAPRVSGHGGRVMGLEQTITYDTRDNIYGARHGSYLLLQHFSAAKITGSEYRVERFKVDARTFFPIRSEHVLALQVLHDNLTGDAPFEQLPTIGGSLMMRGYVPGQYRDRQITSAQAELRLKLIGRFGMTTWGGGAVVCNLHCSASWSDILPTSGVGVRYYLVPAERLTVRVDLGFGRQTHGLYFDFTEAF